MFFEKEKGGGEGISFAHSRLRIDPEAKEWLSLLCLEDRERIVLLLSTEFQGKRSLPAM